MKDEVEENKINIINLQKNCTYCNKLISSDIFQDHILCHQISEEEEEEEKEEEKEDENNIQNNEIIENKKADDTKKDFSSKFLGFFENIGNKAKDLFKKGKKDDDKHLFKIDKEENKLKKITTFFNNITDKISQKFEKISDEIQKKFDKSDSNNDNTPIGFNIYRRNNNYRNDDNIDDLLQEFEEEDNNLNDKKESLFKESDAEEILRYIPNSVVKEEKTKNDNNYKCLICLYEFKIGDKVSTLPCLHIFHIECLKNWIIRNRSCPICKYDCSLDSLLKNNIVDNI